LKFKKQLNQSTNLLKRLVTIAKRYILFGFRSKK
jgi:hypothetical protein